VILAPLHAARAAALNDLLAAAESTGTAATVADSVPEALQLAEHKAHGGQVIVSGSVYLVGEARSLLVEKVEPREVESREVEFGKSEAQR
jgi:folylpolyglutamate synthase/dihydropteroate synthase